MAQATCLADLLQIREHNSDLIERFNGNLGTALGFKYVAGQMTNIPTVIIFVPKKIAMDLIPANQRIPKILQGPNGLSCPTDVVVGGKARRESELPPLSAENMAHITALRSGAIGIVGGVQLGFIEGDQGFVGTAACLVKNSQGVIGLLTNQHVGGVPGRTMYHPDPGNFDIGFTYDAWEMEADEVRFNGLVNEENAYYRMDCAFIKLWDNLHAVARPGLFQIGPINPPIPLDLRTMGPIGTRVTSIGRTRGLQDGTITAFSYEWEDEFQSLYTDYLIIGDDGEVFSDHGDSGKLIVTKDGSNAVALLWGGWPEQLRRGHGQENWTYAIDINKVLEKLDLQIISGT